MKELEGRPELLPVQMEILDVETGKSERRLFPSEEEYLKAYHDGNEGTWVNCISASVLRLQ